MPPRAYTRVAVAQLACQPAIALPGRAPFEDPLFDLARADALRPEGEPPPELDTRFSELRERIARVHREQLLLKVQAILGQCLQWGVRLIVFPEYSLPWQVLEQVARAGGDLVIVAGTHSVTRPARQSGVYERLSGQPPALGQAVCPVLHRGRLLGLQPKLSLTEMEQELRPGQAWSPIPLEGLPGPMGVLICLDFLHREGEAHRKLVAEALEQSHFLAVPSYTPFHTIPEFHAKAQEEAQRYGRPVLWADVAIFLGKKAAGGSSIFVDEGHVGDLRRFPEHAGYLERKLLKAVLESSETSRHRYFHHVFWDALTEGHQELLRAIVRSETVDPRSCEPLVDAGIVEEDAATGRRRLADPVLAARLSPLRIHHLSDIHVSPKSAQSIDAKEAGLLAEALDPGLVRESYLSHLEGLHKSGKAPHVLIISGDLTEWATKEQCQEARSWLDRIPPLLEPHVLLDEDAQRVLLVGGNHDVDWSQTRRGLQPARHQNFADFFHGYAHPHLEVPPADRKLEPIEWPDLGITVLLLGTSELGGQIEEEREHIHLLQELAKLPKAPTKEEREKADELATKAARIDPGLVEARDLRRVSTHPWKESLPVRIAVLHHPPSPLPSTEVASYSGLLNAGAVKQVLMEKGFCLVLCGHVHTGWFAEERWLKHSGGRTLRIAAAPSLGSREIPANNGFNLVEVFRDRDQNGLPKYQVRVRRYVRQGDLGWEEHADQLGPFPPGA